MLAPITQLITLAVRSQGPTARINPASRLCSATVPDATLVVGTPQLHQPAPGTLLSKNNEFSLSASTKIGLRRYIPGFRCELTQRMCFHATKIFE